jgi:hypothetical protein
MQMCPREPLAGVLRHLPTATGNNGKRSALAASLPGEEAELPRSLPPRTRGAEAGLRSEDLGAQT